MSTNAGLTTSLLRRIARMTAFSATTVYPALLLLLASTLWFAYLLVRFPFDGLYGQDSYAYYYQALEIWHKMSGASVPQWPFAGLGLYHWPVGYHLQVIAGFLLSGEIPAGGRFITVMMADTVPVLVFLLAMKVLPLVNSAQKALAGLVSGLVVLFAGVFGQTSLALMSDVPSLFWSLLSALALVHTLPPPNRGTVPKSRWRWILLGGFALGMAVLLRYASILLALPILLYALFWVRDQRNLQKPQHLTTPVLLAALGFCVALAPQLYYLMWQGVNVGYANPLSGWDVANFWRNRLQTGADGIIVFDQPMIAFYALQPLWNAGSGFLSPFYLPLLLVGAWYLLRQACTEVIALLFSWWLLPVIFFSGTAYQAQRFVLFYLTPLALLVGMGVVCLCYGLRRGKFRAQRCPVRPLPAVLVALLFSAGLVQGGSSSRSLVVAQATAKAGELNTVELVRQASSGDRQPRIVAFGLSAALYHYTRWPVIDIYDNDKEAIATFLADSPNRIVVVPEASLARQWANTPVGARWLWLRSQYLLEKVGEAAGYSVYRAQVRKPGNYKQ